MYSQTKKAPAVPVFQQILKNFSPERRCFFYQSLVFIITFLAYASYHINKRPFIVVKSVLSRNCNHTAHHNHTDHPTTYHPWQPFCKIHEQLLLGLLDFSFMMTYSLSLFVSGYLVERMNLRIFLSSGMVLTGVVSTLFGMAYYLRIHSISYFFTMQILAGIVQSSGLPATTEAIGMWIPSGRTGVIYGIWSFHSFLGNIIGNNVSGVTLGYGWGAPFLFTGLIIVLASTLIYSMLIPDPSFVHITIAEKPSMLSGERNTTPLVSLSNKENEEEDNTTSVDLRNDIPMGIDFCTALQIPGVIEFALCTFFVKLVVYTFFFWLPYMIKMIEHVGPSDAAYRTSFYDLGCGLGGILAGIIYDLTETPAIINVIMLLCGAPNMFLMFLHGNNNTMITVYTFLIGLFIGGPFVLMISTLAKRLSTKHYSTTPNRKAIAMLTAIFDGAGSVGASIGPLVTGYIQTWKNSRMYMSYFLLSSILISVVCLSRQFYKEVTGIISYWRKNRYSQYEGYEAEKLMEDTDE